MPVFSRCGRFVVHSDHKTFCIDGETPQELINALLELDEGYPYTHTPTVGEPYEVTHCTINLTQGRYYDDYSNYITEWCKATEADLEVKAKLAKESEERQLSWKREQLERLKAELGET